MENNFDQLHVQLLDITREIIEVCDQHHIQYWLAWGSCLGAVRHQDIIPWDDDIDIYIAYEDLEKLKAAFRSEKGYFYQDIKTDPEYIAAWPKIRKDHTTSMDQNLKALDMHWGICADLFPLVSYDKDRIDNITAVRIKMAEILARMPFYQKIGRKLSHRIWSLLYRVLGESGRKKLYDHCMNGINREGDYFMDPFAERRDMCFQKSALCGEKKFLFHDIHAAVPDEYDQYLKKAYGVDYMEIPPEDSPRRYYHSSSIVDCEKDYREYL